MARIPLQLASRGLQTGPTINYSGLSSSPVGRALEGLGGAISSTAQNVQDRQDEAFLLRRQIEERRQAQLDEISAFEATQNFNQFKIAANDDVAKLAQSIPASGLGLHDGALGSFEKRSQEFLAQVPEQLRPKFNALLDTERAQFSSQMAATELEQRQTWYRGGLEKTLGRTQERVYNDPAALDLAKQEALAEVEASGLSAIEKEEWREKVELGLATSLAARTLEADPASLAMSVGVSTQTADAQSLVQAVIGVESNGNPNAQSPVGASGLMQVMPATGVEIARELGDSRFPASGSVAEQQAYLKREDVSVRYGTHYLNKMLQRYGGDIDAALVAYNGGPARADAWIKANRDDSVIPKESADYYKKVRKGLGTLAAGAPALQSHLKVASAFLGASEGKDGGAIAAFIKKAAGIDIDPRQTAWCAAYVNAVLGSQGIEGTGKLNARSFLDFGEAVDSPSKGDIVVLSRGDPNGWKGHVGFFAGYDANGKVKVLGGNQGNAVSVASYDAGRILGFRRPPSVGNTAEANERLAKLPGGGPTGGMVVTDLDPRFAALPFSERLKIASQARQASAAQASAAEAARKAEYTAYNDSIELASLTGGIASEETILNDPILDDGDKAARLRSFRARQTEASATDIAVRDYLSGGMADMNPLDGDQRTTANKVFDVLTKNLAGAAPEAVQAETNAFIERTGIIPDPVVADLRRGLYSSNPQDYASAMDRAASVQSIAPIAFDNVPNGEALQRDLASYRNLVDVRGLSSTEAAQRLIERRSEDYKRNEAVLGPAADKAIKDLAVSDVTSDFGGVFGFRSPGAGADTATQTMLLSEYRDAFREEFIRSNGDEDEAKTQAIRALRKTWDVSEVSGEPELMKFPPERFYPKVEGGHRYLRDDAMMTALDMAGEDADPAAITNVMLRPSPATAADVRAGRPPRYRLFFTRDVDGVEVIDEVPGYWAATDANVAAQSARQTNMEGAQTYRLEQSDRPSGIDRDEAMDMYLGGYGVPRPAEQRGTMVLPDAPPAPGTADAINDRLQGQRQELFDRANR